MKNKARRFESLSYGFESLLKLKLKAEGQIERFESSSYESLLGAKFKYYKGDSNHLYSDLNPSFYKSIKCSTCSSNNSIFNSNLSHND